MAPGQYKPPDFDKLKFYKLLIPSFSVLRIDFKVEATSVSSELLNLEFFCLSFFSYPLAVSSFIQSIFFEFDVTSDGFDEVYAWLFFGSNNALCSMW